MNLPIWIRDPIRSVKRAWSPISNIIRNHPSDITELKDRAKHQALVIESLTSRLLQVEAMLKNETSIAVDVSLRGLNYVFVAGRYKGQDYVRCFGLRTDDLSQLVQQLRSMERLGHVAFIDAPPGVEASIKRGLKSW